MPIFGTEVTLPSFRNPDDFHRNVVPGFIPSPTLIFEEVTTDKLENGDLVLFIGSLWRVNADTLLFGAVDQQTGSIPIPFNRSNPTIAQRVTHLTFGSLANLIPIEWLRDDSIRYYGKFANQVEAYCWEWALEDYNNSVGDAECGWHATRIDITKSSDGRVCPMAHDATLSQWRDVIGIDYPAGFIITEDSSGFVDVEFFRRRRKP